ncbi:protein phosphatase 1 regulatory subunit 37 [Chelonus insularis]|uniref:protein phosphatase 1 regulatory subunit 37 n=1 Tax=Chelonus insularis TaxID=460826 RepID=UPI00158E523C|nr:protein phosphatase 1 regulatory subunit 37 [Chelonus insularis]
MNESFNIIDRDCDQLLFQSSSSSTPSSSTALSESLPLESTQEVGLEASKSEDLSLISNIETPKDNIVTSECVINVEKLNIDDKNIKSSSTEDILVTDDDKLRPVEKKWPPRSVSFPPNDKDLVTGYLEPANPWEQAQDVSIENLILAYKESCDRHHTHPLDSVIAQLEKLELINERCEELTLKNEQLSRNFCEPLEEVLKRLQFKKIDLESASLDDESAETLFDMFEYYESVTHLNISSNCNIGERGWQACSQMIKKTQCLEQLEARDIVLTQQHMNILKRPLQLVTHLHVLKLENCGLAGRAFIILISALKHNTGLKELYLADNGLGNPDAVQLGALLRANHHLQLLDVSNNNLQDHGVRDILDGLVTQSKEAHGSQGLSILILWNNHITKESSGRFAELLAISKSLETLNIGQNLMGDEFLEVCKDALKKNNSLLQLGVQATGLMQKGILALAEVIEKNDTLQRIDLRDNNLQLTGLTFLSIALKKNSSITRIDLDDKAWSKSPPLIEQYAELIQEIRSYCLRNEETLSTDESTEELSSSEHRSRLSSVSSRKISLTCQTLPRSPPLMATASEVTGRTMMMPGSVPKRTSGGRLRSPAPSPIPSPVASPIPSPSRGRFVVSRVSEASLSSTNSSASSSPITPPSLPSPSFFPGDGSRFRVTVVPNPVPPPPPPTTTTTTTTTTSQPINLPELKVDVPEVVDSDDSDSVFRAEPEDLRIDSESSADGDFSCDDLIKDIGTNNVTLLSTTTIKAPTTTTASIQSPKIVDEPDTLKHTSSLDRLLGLFHNPGGIFTSAFDTSSAKNPFHESVNSMMALGDKFQRYLRESRALDVISHDAKCKKNDKEMDEAFNNAHCNLPVKQSYVPAAIDEPFVDNDKKECLMLPRTFNHVQSICDSNTKSSINYPNFNNDTHHSNLTCDVNNLLDDDKDVNIPIIYESISEASSIDDHHEVNPRSQMNLFIDRSINHRNSQDSGIEESNISTSDDHYNDSNRPKEHFQGSVDSGIESECSPVCNKVPETQEDQGCLKELRIALNIPTLDDNKTNVDQLIYQSVEGS